MNVVSYFIHFSNGRSIFVKCNLIEFHYYKQYTFYFLCVGLYLLRIVIICLQKITLICGQILKVDGDRKKSICEK